MYSLIGLMIFLAIGGDTWVIQGLARTYEVIGIDETPAIGTLVAGASQAFASIFLSAIQVAGPIILALILTDARSASSPASCRSSTSSPSASPPR